MFSKICIASNAINPAVNKNTPAENEIKYGRLSLTRSPHKELIVNTPTREVDIISKAVRKIYGVIKKE